MQFFRSFGGGGGNADAYRLDNDLLSEPHAIAISVYRTDLLASRYRHMRTRRSATENQEEEVMKVWTKPAVREQEVGLEVTSYLPAEIDII